jgi:hypothetical protein
VKDTWIHALLLEGKCENGLYPLRFYKTSLQGKCALAYGMLLLEVAAERRPIDSSNFVLIDHVMECHQSDRIREVVDPKLNSIYVIDEVELVLELGLLCSHHRPEAWPTMKQVMRYLNRDYPLPAIDDWGSVDSQSFSEMNSRMLLEAVSSNTITSANGNISTTSIDTGR